MHLTHTTHNYQTSCTYEGDPHFTSLHFPSATREIHALPNPGDREARQVTDLIQSDTYI